MPRASAHQSCGAAGVACGLEPGEHAALPLPACTELARFLADPERKAWVFKAAEANRRHMEETIKRAGCDVDTATDRHGRPYSLLCTKNQASYERRVRQRRQDLRDLERLAG